MEKDVIPPNIQLSQAREKANWSLDRVAFTLNLSVSSLLALEEGRFERLHADAFVIGYMRSYAELFDLDGDALVAEYKLLRQPSTIADFNEPETHTAKQNMRSQYQKYRAGYGIAAAFTLMAALSLLSPSDEQHKPQNDQDIAIETAAGATVISSINELPPENPTQDMVPTIVLKQNVAREQVDQLLKQRILGGSSITGSSKNNTSLIENSSLSFQFSADCWVEIKDGDDQIIFASLQKAQERLELSGKPPFHITLGYAPGVELSYNGQSVEINTARENIARLVLGNS